jgi:hypothetical protein
MNINIARRSVAEPGEGDPTSQVVAEQYRQKAQSYRAAAAVETDPGRREAFELLADTFDRLAAAYARIKPSGE